MATVFTLTVYGALEDTLPAGVADKWEAVLKGERARILSHLTTKIPNETVYQNKLADASSDRYEAFLTTVGSDWDADEIEMKQRIKLARKYSAWATGIASAFAEGGAFDINVTAKKGKTEAMRYPIGLVGKKSTDRWRCGSLLALGLGGDKRIERYITSPDTLAPADGIEVALATPYNLYDRPFIVANVVKYGTLAKFADVLTDKTIRNAMVTALNTNLDLIEGHVKAAHTLTLTTSWDGTYNHIKIVAVLATA